MAKPTSRFVCQGCGALAPKWAGRCEACGEWNTIVEEAATPHAGPNRPGPKSLAGKAVAFVGLAGEAAPPPRASTGIAELDRVLGGGLVPGSAVLIGGDRLLDDGVPFAAGVAAAGPLGRDGAAALADETGGGLGQRGQGPRGRGECGPGVRGRGVGGLGVRGPGVRGPGVRGAGVGGLVICGLAASPAVTGWW